MPKTTFSSPLYAIKALRDQLAHAGGRVKTETIDATTTMSVTVGKMPTLVDSKDFIESVMELGVQEYFKRGCK